MACLMTPPPTPSKKPIIDLPTRLRLVRERLVESGTYLGTSAIRENVVWHRVGKSQKLMLAAQDITTTPVSAASATTEELSDTPTDDLHLEETAILSAVVKISDEDFYLTSDGGYRGPGRFISSLAQVKPSCSGGAPDADPFSADYPQVIDNVNWLLKEATTPGFNLKRGFLAGPTTAQRLKVRHVLFEPLEESAPAPTSAEEDKENKEPTEDADDRDTNSSALANPNNWTHIANWPVNSDEARAELADMIDTHRVNPIPVYDMHGHLVHPQFYRNRLVGATCELDFELTHWAMKSRNGEPSCNTYTADIVAVRVLIPPKPTVVTPRKRKVYHKMDPLASPSPRKKARYF